MATSAEDMRDKLARQQSEQQQSAQQATSTQGIIQSAAEYKAPETKPVTTQVNAGDETVEGRVNRMVSKGSDYLEYAKTDAMRNANSRGLINSSIAAGAGTEAAYRNALPIAQQDAKTYTDTRILNQNTENDFLKNRQSADLNKETASHQSTLNIGEENNRSQNTMAEATHNADLNTARAYLDSELKKSEEQWSVNLRTQADQILNDAKFSDEIKLQYVNSINQIMRDSQQQITDIGLSDRTAQAQAAAIKRIEENRDAQIAVYQDLLTSFNDWQWSTDFTMGVQTNASGAALPGQQSQANATPPPTQAAAPGEVRPSNLNNDYTWYPQYQVWARQMGHGMWQNYDANGNRVRGAQLGGS